MYAYHKAQLTCTVNRFWHSLKMAAPTAATTIVLSTSQRCPLATRTQARATRVVRIDLSNVHFHARHSSGHLPITLWIQRTMAMRVLRELDCRTLQSHSKCMLAARRRWYHDARNNFIYVLVHTLRVHFMLSALIVSPHFS